MHSASYTTTRLFHLFIFFTNARLKPPAAKGAIFLWLLQISHLHIAPPTHKDKRFTQFPTSPTDKFWTKSKQRKPSRSRTGDRKVQAELRTQGKRGLYALKGRGLVSVGLRGLKLNTVLPTLVCVRLRKEGLIHPLNPGNTRLTPGQREDAWRRCMYGTHSKTYGTRVEKYMARAWTHVTTLRCF